MLGHSFVQGPHSAVPTAGAHRPINTFRTSQRADQQHADHLGRVPPAKGQSGPVTTCGRGGRHRCSSSFHNTNKNRYMKARMATRIAGTPSRASVASRRSKGTTPASQSPERNDSTPRNKIPSAISQPPRKPCDSGTDTANKRRERQEDGQPPDYHSEGNAGEAQRCQQHTNERGVRRQMGGREQHAERDRGHRTRQRESRRKSVTRRPGGRPASEGIIHDRNHSRPASATLERGLTARPNARASSKTDKVPTTPATETERPCHCLLKSGICRSRQKTPKRSVSTRRIPELRKRAPVRRPASI